MLAQNILDESYYVSVMSSDRSLIKSPEIETINTFLGEVEALIFFQNSGG